MKAFRKYWAFARIAATEAAAERATLYGRALFFAVILGVFSALWRAVAEAGMPLAARHQDLVWYLAITEWILLSAPLRHLEIQEQVRRGDVAYQLPRPVSFPRATFAQCLGMLLVHAPILGAVAFGSAYAFTGTLPSPKALLCVVPFGLLAAAVLAELYVALGLLSFWISDATPLYWVASKLMFILGGLMLPLELYPRWLQIVAACTPFPSLLSGPGSFVLHDPGSLALSLGLQLGFWALALFGLVELLFRRAVLALQVGGG
jgi:ABC-2 type transport system permease protein